MVLVASTFVAEPALGALRYWLGRQRLEVELELAPYGQVLEQLRGREAGLSGPGTDLGVLLVRVEDYLRREDARLDSSSAAFSRATRNVEELCSAIARHAEEGGCRLLLAAMPASGGAPAAVEEVVARGRERLERCAVEHDCVSRLDIEDCLDLHEVRRIADPRRDELAHIPYREECLAAVGTAVARRIRALWAPPCKLIALDCDNTLWGGACSEDPIEELDPGGSFAYLREFMRAQADAGRLLALVSRNPDADVRRAFARHAAPLTEADVVARRCGWEAKADSLRSIAVELDLGVESFAFVDDDPVECAAVRAELPEVAVVELGGDPRRIPGLLRHAWELDLTVATAADRCRSRSYLANRRLRDERAGAEDHEAFIDGLAVEVVLAPLGAADRDRFLQLFHRTNQFNATGWRPTESELRQRLAAPGAAAWVVRVSDRLADHGLVGALLTASEAGELRIEQAALSCRVFGRRVERAMLAALIAAVGTPPRRLLLNYRDSGRNVPVRRLLDQLGVPEHADAGAPAKLHELPLAAILRAD